MHSKWDEANIKLCQDQKLKENNVKTMRFEIWYASHA